jgi:predicted ATPase/class 3 adenylate cyclase
MRHLPTGTVTFLFTDIEGSMPLWELHREAMQEALARHDGLLGHAIAAHHGFVFKTVGDQFCASFSDVGDAVAAAVEVQKALGAEDWTRFGLPAHRPLGARLALYTGSAEPREGDYFGPPVNRCARLVKAGHPGQVLLAAVTKELVSGLLAGGIGFKDLGEHRLRGLEKPERVFQLVHPDLPSQFPPLQTLSILPTNLPVPLTSFIGRQREIEEIQSLITHKGAFQAGPRPRLLTLIGVGGCGKTRLALEVAAKLFEEFPDGIWWVELAALTDPALVPQTVATAVGVREETGLTPVRESAARPLMERLTDALQGKTLLMVLDNCEHLITACAHLAQRLLQGCPGLRILATSREGLGIAGELTYPVPSLSLPDASPREAERPASWRDGSSLARSGGTDFGQASLEALMQSEAVRLFVERAHYVQPRFTLTPQNAWAVIQICQRLDGIPLAIELAAARVKAISVEQIAARLDSVFRLLTGGSRTALPRQQTLQALIDWSFHLLSEAERALFCRLSVFASGWTLEAAEAIGQRRPEGVAPLWGAGASDVLDLMTQLVNKSLVLLEEHEDEPRYRLLETIRQYGRAKLLASGETEEMRRRHRDFFWELAERAYPATQGPDQETWLRRLDREHDNLRAALAWSLSRGEAEAALRLAGALWWYWHVRGHWSEGRRWLKEALLLDSPTTAGARAKALNGLGVLSWRQGDYERATAFCQESLALARDLGDKDHIAILLNVLGLIAHHQGDDARAIHLLEESLALSRELDNGRHIAYALNVLGLIAHRQGDHARAAELCQESLVRRRELGDKRGIAISLRGLGAAVLHQGNPQQAAALFQESLEHFRELGDRWGISDLLSNLGHVALQQLDPARADELFRESLAMHRELGDKSGIAICFEGLAKVACAKSQWEHATRLFSSADALRHAIGAPLPAAERAEYERCVAQVRAHWGEESFSRAWAEAQGMGMGPALECALASPKRP